MEGFLEITGCFWLTFAAASTVSYSSVKVTPGSRGFQVLKECQANHRQVR